MSEMEPWTRQLLSVIVSQLCKTIGWHSISTTCLQVLVDVLHRYLKQLGTNVHDYTEHFNHTFPATEELNLALLDMGVNIEDLKEYVDYVTPIPIKMKVPQYPLEKKSNMNFLKPGSREVVTRPVHIHEHLPAMRPELLEESYVNQENVKENSTTTDSADTPSTSSTFKKPGENGQTPINKQLANLISEEMGRPVRELSCVMMTTSGFLSPAREGKLPEARLPKAVHNVVVTETVANQPTAPASAVPESKSEHKKSNHSKSSSKTSERKNREEHQTTKDENDDSKIKKLSHTKEIPKLKTLKPSSTKPTESTDTAKLVRQEKLKIPEIVVQKEAKPQKLSKLEKKLEKLQEHQQVATAEKLTTEPNKQKLNIFKRISKVKEDRAESPVPKMSEDKNTSINESIENVVKGVGEKEFFKNAHEKERIVEPVTEAYSEMFADGSKAASAGKKFKRKKKQKIRDVEPSTKKIKLNNNMNSVEVEYPKPSLLEQPPYPFFTSLPDSLETNYLIPRFTNPFMNMTKLDPNCPHPEMPNLPLPPPMMPTTMMDDRQRSPAKNIESDKKLLDPHVLSISDKKLKKKMKKDKREKDKRKRDKKDKVKNKEKLEAKKQDKILKKVKNKDKLKKKVKLNALKEDMPEDPSVPKIKLRIGGTNSPLPSPSGVQSPKINVSIVKHDDVPRYNELVREASPELAKISALVSKPPKIKSQPKISSESVLHIPKQVVEPITLSTKAKKGIVSAEIKPKNKEKQHKSKKTEGSNPKPEPYYYDADGNQVWVCPTCGGPDDGSPMIGCDGCDAWYHWVCVGIKSAPESAKWFCGLCVHS